MADSRRKGGPRRLDDESARSFMLHAGTGSLCFEDGEGRLCATPVDLRASSEATLVFAAPDIRELARATKRGGHACFVADEFETYEGIKGVIVRGTLASGGSPPPQINLLIDSVIGFSFANTLPARFKSPATDDGTTNTSD
jgi:hypothetical protein